MNVSEIKSFRFFFVYPGILLVCSVIFVLTAYSHYRRSRDEIAEYSAAFRNVSECRIVFVRFSQIIGSSKSSFTSTKIEEYLRRSEEVRRAVSTLSSTSNHPEVTDKLDKDIRAIQQHIFTLKTLLTLQGDPDAEIEMQMVSAFISKTIFNISNSFNLLEKSTFQEYQKKLQPDNSFFVRTVIFLLLFMIVFSLLLLIIDFFLVRKMRAGLSVLREGTQAIQKGKLTYRFRKILAGDIGQVQYDFNTMAQRIDMQSSELKKANNDLRIQTEQLKEANAHKDRFLANMSHELRTPLNSIIGFSELLDARAEKISSEKIHSYSKRILFAAEHLLALISSLLQLAKHGAGTLKAQPSLFDLSALVTDSCSLLAPLAAKKNIEVRREIQTDVKICADEQMIRQIFINLYSNAVKYTFSGYISIRLSANENKCFLEVEDTGIGISDEEQKKLFQDFYRVESAEKIAVDGVGIGLALSRRLAALNNGIIRFVSQKGKGSTFTLELPVPNNIQDK